MPIQPSFKWKGKSEKEQDKLQLVLTDLITKGEKILSLTVGDPPAWGFGNQSLSNHLSIAAEEGWHSYGGTTNEYGIYPNPSITSRLQTAIAGFEKRERNIEFDSNNIFPCGGCGGALTCLHYSILEDGDEIVVVEPSHYLGGPTSYFSYFNAKTIESRMIEEEKWEPDLEELRKKISNRAKAIMIINPNNPTGAVYDEKTLKNIIDVAGEYDLPIISDEIYGLITYDGIVAKSTAAITDDVPVIVINGLTKFFMRPGWRVGYIAFHDPEDNIKQVIDVTRRVWSMYGHQAYGMPLPIRYAAIKAFEGPIESSKKMVEELEIRRNYSLKRINEIDGLNCVKPKGSYYLFPRLNNVGENKTWNSVTGFLIDLVLNKNVTFLPGNKFGKHGTGHFRMLFLPKIEILEDVFNRLENFLKKNM